MKKKSLMQTLAVLCTVMLLLSLAVGSVSADASAETPETEIDTIPESYDLRELGFVTSVKRQGDFGTCWAFAAINAIESNAIMQGFETAETADFSELHLIYFLYNRTGVTVGNVLPELEGLAGDTIELHKNVDYLEMGGNPFMAALHLATGIGVVREENAPYSWVEQNPNIILAPESAVQNNVYFVSDAVYSKFSDRDEVKTLLMKYGCGAFNHYSDLDNFNYIQHNNTQITTCHQTKKTGTNHAVSLAGWDDNYPKENFKIQPKNNGAWLVKNSWSQYWGDGGYFWLSYEDTSLNNVVFYEVKPENTCDTIYQYDGSSSLEYYKEKTVKDGKFSISAANSFMAKSEEIITDVSFMTLNKNMDYTVSVIVGDAVSATESGTLPYCGYHTIPLTTEVLVLANQTFDVRVDLSVSSASKDIYGENRLSLPFDASMKTSLADIVSESKPGQGYLIISAGEQDGTMLLNGKGGNFRIKAYGIAKPEPAPLPIPELPAGTNPFEGIISAIIEFFKNLFG